MDGVAAASACRRSTPLRTMSRRLSSEPSRSRRTLNVLSGAPNAPPSSGPASSAGVAASHRARLHDRGELVHGAARLRIDRRPHAERIDGRLQRRDLRRELARGFAVAGVLHPKHDVRLLELGNRGPGAPPRTEPDQHRDREHAQQSPTTVGRREMVTRRTTPVVRSASDDGVALRSQQPPVPSLVGSAFRSFGEVRTLPYGPTRWKRRKSLWLCLFWQDAAGGPAQSGVRWPGHRS